jgi:glyoxylase-like metal-dependent hydrolase (beta-lactamase superfamily II)
LQIHHLNCATLCPVSAKLVNDVGSLFSPAKMVCHCLLIETKNTLILVDTGLGSQDLTHPENLGSLFRHIIRPKLSFAETAVEQVRKLGFSTHDVRHIILTHLDLDHAGGLPDFPSAEIHVSDTEYNSAMTIRSFRNEFRYRTTHWLHRPNWKTHTVEGDKWFGFEAVRAIDNKETDVLLIPLRGHTDGHCGVAVKSSDKWILNCGDAYFFHAEMSLHKPYCSLGLTMFQRIMENDRKARIHNQHRLQELKRNHGNDIQMFCSHDHSELCKYKEDNHNERVHIDSPKSGG